MLGDPGGDPRPRATWGAAGAVPASQPDGRRGLPVRNGRPGQGEVLELAHVVRVVVDRQPPLLRPRERVGPSALSGEHARPQRRDRPHLGEVVTDVAALRLLQETECRRAAARSPPSAWTPPNPTCLSAAPRSTGPVPGVTSRIARS